MRRVLLALSIAFLAPADALAQDTPPSGPAPVDDVLAEDEDDEAPDEVDPDAVPALTLPESALEAGSDEEDEEEEDEDAIIPPPPSRGPSEDELIAEEEAERAEEEPDGEPTIIDDDMELEGDPPDLPEWRLRAGAGVALPTAGDSIVWFRATQDVEWQPRGVEPFLFGLGGSEMVGGDLFGQASARIGLHAWFCDERPMRCQAAVVGILGAVFGTGFAAFDGAGEVDLRLLFWDTLELHVRGGFHTVQGVSFIDITGGLGVAF